MSRAAVVHMTRDDGAGMETDCINVNAICPGYIDTEINHHHWGTRTGTGKLDRACCHL